MVTTSREPGCGPGGGPVQQVAAEQRAHLVSGQPPPVPAGLRAGHRNGQPVAVRVAGQHQVGPEPARLRQRQVERAGFLRVGEGDGGEVGVGVGLGRDPVRRREPGPGDGLEHQRPGHAVHRGVDHPQRRAAAGLQPQGGFGGERGQVGAGDLVAVPGDERAVERPGRYLAQRAERPDRGLDLGVGGRDDLGPVGEVQLVAVVRGRVVTRGDHDAGGGGQLPDRERQQRRRARSRQQVNAQPGAGQHPRRLVGEPRRTVPGIGADDHAGAGGPGLPLAQPAGQRRGRGPDHRPVHPVRPGRHHAAQPRGAELQPAAEPIGQLGGRLGAVVGQQPPQLGPVAGIGVVGDPRLDPGPQPRRDHEEAGGDGPGQDRGQQRAHPVRGRLARGDHFLVVQLRPAQAGRGVGDQRQAQHLGAEVAGGDRLQHRGHPDQVGAEQPEHADLGRGLVVRSWQPGVDALGQAGVGLQRQPAQPRRVRLGEVGEPGRETIRRRRAGQRRAAGEVQVVADDDRLPDPVAADPAGRVGQHDHPAARRDRGAHPVHHGGRRVPLVQVRPAEEYQHPRPARPHRADQAGVAGHRGRREPAQVRQRTSPPAGSPMSAAAEAQPEPSTTATSCRGCPVSSPSRTALAAAAA